MFGISGKYQMDYDMEKGLMGNKKFHKTSYSTSEEAINLHRKSLVDILKEPIDFIKNVIVDNLETISGAIQDGIEFGKAKIKGAFDNIYVSITGFKKNLNLKAKLYLCVNQSIL